MSADPFRWLLPAIFALLSPALAAVSADPVDCATTPLQEAIDAAEPGSVLTLSGLCTGNFEIDKDLTLKGSPATLDGESQGPVLTVSGNATAPRVWLQDLTLQHGGTYVETLESNYSAGGLLLANAGSATMVVTLERVTLADNAFHFDEDSAGAGGIATLGPVALTLRDTTLVRNGGIGPDDNRVVGGIRLGALGQLVMFDSHLIDNENNGDGNGSGGIDCFGHCVILGGSMTGNYAGRDSAAGGAFTVRTDGYLFLQDALIEGNRSDSFGSGAGGGAVFGRAEILGTRIQNNQGDGDRPTAGGLYVAGGSLLLQDSQLSGNAAGNGSGGLTLDRSGASAQILDTQFNANQGEVGGIDLNSGTLLQASDVKLTRNQALVGAIRLGEAALLTLMESRVQNNRGEEAGGIQVVDPAQGGAAGQVLLLDTRVFNNTPTDCSGFTDPACQ